MMRTAFDRNIAKAVSLTFLRSVVAPLPSNIDDVTIAFQFPPRILSDNQQGNWKDGELPGVSPIAVYATTSAREMTLSWTYMVEDFSTEALEQGGGDLAGKDIWSISKIKENINLLRGYFSRIRSLQSDRSAMTVRFRYPWLTGNKTWSCRLKSVDVKHGDTLVGTPGNIFPLRSDISVDIRLWTTGIYAGQSSSQGVQQINGLDPEPSPKDLWY
jgi:hypothetical protein